MDVHAPLADAQRRFERFEHARALGVAGAEPVLDDFEDIDGVRCQRLPRACRAARLFRAADRRLATLAALRLCQRLR